MNVVTTGGRYETVGQTKRVLMSYRQVADAYLAEVVNPDLDIESDKCTVDDIVMGKQ